MPWWRLPVGLCSVLLVSIGNPTVSNAADHGGGEVPAIFSRRNLIAWCIVPFDAKKRGPEERVAMLKKLKFERYAYDWRAEHLPSFERELQLLRDNGIKLQAVWFPAQLDADAKKILELLRKYKIRTELWVTMADPAPGSKNQADKVAAAVKILKPIAEAAAKIDCSLGLYNHGNWFGEPENELAIIDALKMPNVGLVYNLHHGHDHLDRFPELLRKMLPHLYAINLNGMFPKGDQLGLKILPLGTDDLDLTILRTIKDSGYRGPLGILGHTQDDVEERLRDNLDGFDWLVANLTGGHPGPRPKPRTPVPPLPKARAIPTYSRDLVEKLVAEAKAHGDIQRGAFLFRQPTSACLSCHKVDGEGGTIGPDLSNIGKTAKPQDIVESLLWPKRQVKPDYFAVQVVTRNGRAIQGYRRGETDKQLILVEPGTDKQHRIHKSTIEERNDVGTLMPEDVAAALTPSQRSDLIRFLMELGYTPGVSGIFHVHRAPLRPSDWPHWQDPVNRDRIYDYYAKEAEHFQHLPHLPHLLPEFPGLDGGKYGHWGNQKEETWVDSRWSRQDLGPVMCGVFHGAGVTVPKGVCVQLGEHGELAACFNPETLCYEALWQGGFVRVSAVRHGFMDGLQMVGTALARPQGSKPEQPFVYHGYYRHGKRIVFSYRLGNVEMLDAPWIDDKGKFTRVVVPADKHPFADLTRGGPAQWPQVIRTQGKRGQGRPYAVDEITLPFKNPWNSLLFIGGHAFLPSGSAVLCTMQGEVWRVDGLDDSLAQLSWRRIATGLHQALGMVVDGDSIYVLGRDQITRLVDLNGDGEIDFYECVTNAYRTSAAGHDFICGLERDPAGNFYTASGSQGILRISPQSGKVEVLATGIRNPDGVCLLPDGGVTFPFSEGEWTPASAVGLVPGKSRSSPPFFGYGGPRDGKPPALPLAYLPRGLDNSSGGQVVVPDDRWGPLRGQVIHFSYGAGSHFLLLRDEVQGQAQGAIVPLAGEFLSGAHRGRFNPKDGQLYVSGMGGWGTYTPDDGCFQRVRYTGDPVQLPTRFHVYQNGILVRFSQALDSPWAVEPSSHFAQCWNYRYSAGYGSAELSPSHAGIPGHDHLTIASAHVTPDGHGLFLEIPALQPVNQLHLHLSPARGETHDMIVTVHKLDEPYTGFKGYRPTEKTIAAHPILTDLAITTKRVPNPWRKPIPGARKIELSAGTNLSYSTRSFTVKAGAPIVLVFYNPDVVPHNWVLIKPGQLERIGDLTNKMIADPEAVARHYVPNDPAVLAYTDITSPQQHEVIYFKAPTEKGRYPFLCTFPGHWKVMNGQMIVE
jgi:putative heme-binding domain-containing protein